VDLVPRSRTGPSRPVVTIIFPATPPAQDRASEAWLSAPLSPLTPVHGGRFHRLLRSARPCRREQDG
jgi:hypothetical protein